MKITTHRIKNCGAFVAALLLASAPLWAQTNTGIVVGSDGTIKPTNAIPPLRAALNAPTLAGTNTFTGDNTFGDAAGDKFTVKAGTFGAPNATNVESTNMVNVGALDNRYLRGNDMVLEIAKYPVLRPGAIALSATSGTNWSGWSAMANLAVEGFAKYQTASSPAGWARASWYNFALRAGEAATTLADRGWTFAAMVNFPSDSVTNYGMATDIYFGSTYDETGGALTNRGLRVRVAGNDPASAYRVTAAIHNGTNEITASADVSVTALGGALVVRWLPVGGYIPGAGSKLQVWSRPLGGTAAMLCEAALTNSIGAAAFAGSGLTIVAAATNSTPGYTANWEIYGISYYIH